MPKERPPLPDSGEMLRQQIKDSQAAAQKQYEAHYAKVLETYQWAERSEAHSSIY